MQFLFAHKGGSTACVKEEVVGVRDASHCHLQYQKKMKQTQTILYPAIEMTNINRKKTHTENPLVHKHAAMYQYK